MIAEDRRCRGDVNIDAVRAMARRWRPEDMLGIDGYRPDGMILLPSRMAGVLI